MKVGERKESVRYRKPVYKFCINCIHFDYDLKYPYERFMGNTQDAENHGLVVTSLRCSLHNFAVKRMAVCDKYASGYNGFINSDDSWTSYLCGEPE